MPSRDYSDSEDEIDARESMGGFVAEGVERPQVGGFEVNMKTEEDERGTYGVEKPISSGIRIKFRHPKAPSSHERSSLSPPPPLTLKFGLPPSAPSTSRPSKAERAAYSSSEDDEAGPSAPTPKGSNSKAKKPRVSVTKNKKRALEPAPSLEPPAVGQLAGRKSYDWLLPSFAGASHHGPIGREREENPKKIQKLGPSEIEFDDPIVVEKEVKRSHKKKKDSDVAGPGKAWRKGVKKGMVRTPKDIGLDTPASSTPGNSRPGSPEGTPEEDEGRAIHMNVDLNASPEGPFVLADPKEMGIPVFSNPIAAPRIALSNFPKVTPFFLPNNGGDSGAFPRREKTRSWKSTDRELVGIGGGKLKFKAWAKGPPGDLTNVLKAEKDVQDIKAKANKENADSKLKISKDKDGVEIKPKAPRDSDVKPKAAKEKDESKKASKEDGKPKQPRTIAIAPRPSPAASSKQSIKETSAAPSTSTENPDNRDESPPPANSVSGSTDQQPTASTAQRDEHVGRPLLVDLRAGLGTRAGVDGPMDAVRRRSHSDNPTSHSLTMRDTIAREQDIAMYEAEHANFNASLPHTALSNAHHKSGLFSSTPLPIDREDTTESGSRGPRKSKLAQEIRPDSDLL